MFFIKIILLLFAFILELVYLKQLTVWILKTGWPKMILYLLTAIPLLIFEEQIDCQPWWCGKVLIPPTLGILIIEVLVLALLSKLFRTKQPWWPAAAYAIFGIFFELTIGGLRGVNNPVILVLLIPWVALGYIFVSILPLSILLRKKH